ncbi:MULTISPECIES: hypothetical protein [unclassified Streptomyces]|uniref:hypothetical protein n=1 Tax=unclassified Streptomyces TaxID=2593676 RepID=UPI000823B247|nr:MULTISPECIES: hypothetical protein [unclassified Streptomyces]SCK55643.1 hypothetical protein YW7DRAFT_05153 [Streptomyces sp. AmelKG-E11A]
MPAGAVEGGVSFSRAVVNGGKPIVVGGQGGGRGAYGRTDGGSDPGERLDEVAAAYQDLAASFWTAARLRYGLLVWIG